jgi:hypothetical protein
VCRRAAESASPQGRVLAHTCGESKYFAGSGGAGAQLQLIYGFADYFAAAPCVRLPSSLTRTRAHTLAQITRAHAAALCVLCVSVIVRQEWKRISAAKSSWLSQDSLGLHLRTIWPMTLFAQAPPTLLTSTRKFRLRDALRGLIKNTEC